MSVRITSADLDLKNPLTASQYKKIFALTIKLLKGSPEYLSFVKTLGVPKSVEVHFCDDIEMRDYQKRFRNLDRTTDVLSFPSIETPSHTEKNFMGSLIISLATVERNSKRYKRKFKDELAEVYVHGILHLLTFDHVKVSRTRKERMRKIQKQLFLKVKTLL